jgi:hypothetical protein
MKNFDDPDLGQSDDRAAVPGPLVEITGDLDAVGKRFQEQLAGSISGDAARIGERFRAAGVHAPLTGALTTSIGESLRKTLAADSAARKDAVMKSLRAVDVPERIIVRPITTRAKPLEIPNIRPIADVRLEEVVNAVNRLIDVAEQEKQALVAIDDAMEERHAETERNADERADRADNRAAWGVTFAGVAAFLVVIEFFFR